MAGVGERNVECTSNEPPLVRAMPLRMYGRSAQQFGPGHFKGAYVPPECSSWDSNPD